MYGLIGRIRAVDDGRDELAAILDGMGEMPGCLSYVVASDVSDPDVLWVTEVWDSPEAHAASLGLPTVRAAIEQGRPLIAAFEQRTETRPIGGVGLAGQSLDPDATGDGPSLRQITTLEVGLGDRRTIPVTAQLSPAHLAPTVVLSTPDMIRLMEETCTAAVQPLIEANDQTTVGVHVSVSHESAAREGESVTVTCELVGIDRRRLTFRVAATVGDRIIGQGTHQRHIIDRSRFADL